VDNPENTGISNTPMEKSGQVPLTVEELEQAFRGVLPESIHASWNLTLEELGELLREKGYEIVPPKQSNTNAS
jgi:hypothetical protein